MRIIVFENGKKVIDENHSFKALERIKGRLKIFIDNLLNQIYFLRFR